MKDTLRSRAEKLAATDEANAGRVLTPEETSRTLHELRVHQIELEMQNEELRRALAELEISRERYFDLYDMAPVGYLTLSEQGLILEANFTLAAMLGQSRSTLTRQPISRFILKEDQDVYYRHRRRLIVPGESQACELRMVRSDASPVWVRIEAVLVQDADGALVQRATINDITERKCHDELREQIEGIIRHDLRSPACNAMNLAQLLKLSHNLTPEEHHLVDLLLSEGKQMLDTLNSSLDLYKIEVGQYHGEAMSFDCLPLVVSVSDTLLRVPRHQVMRLVIRSNGLPPVAGSRHPCLGQYNLLRAALHNLIQNALEASPQDATVFVNLTSGPDCRIEIRNKGLIPLDIRERFFEKYATSGKRSGTGLGAYSAKKMIEAQGGSIEMFTLDENEETSITIHLPRGAGEHEEHRRNPPQPPGCVES
ncbi:sensor histidine kinase [Fundidesulfovibrio agrisoli]|uniref:sensor histidine kinase n=1 Tax=Fundidesulfovibrio agrisoli TaxID=2922717 RepID=UPI001FAB5E2F|nr:PAS domain-containing sensor histidine kinase [Fundidesulfovibrio agrisoli]